MQTYPIYKETMEDNTSTIGKEFTIGGLIKFVSAPIVTRLLMSMLRTLDDSLFLSRYCGKNALAAFTIAMPWFMLTDAFGMILGSVGTLCSMKMGEKKHKEAERSFTTMTILAFCVGAFFSLILTLFREKILIFLGATDVLLPYAKAYMDVSRFYTPLVMMSYILSRFYVIAGKPKHSMITMVLSTFCNFFFDWLFIVKLKTGIVGTAYANLIGNVVTTVYAIVFFLGKDREIRFGKPLKKFGNDLKQVVKLGASQSLISIALAVNSYICNRVLLGIGGEDVVAAYTIVGNIQFMFMECFFGMLGTTSPIVSYAYGEKNKDKLGRIIKQVALLISGLTVCIVVIFYSLKNLLLSFYMSEEDTAVIRDLANYGMNLAPLAFIFFGYNCMVQDVATAVGNAKTCTVLTVLENVIMSNLATILLPKLFGINGVWYIFIIQEVVTFLFTALAVYLNRDMYGYGRSGKAAAFADYY